MSANIISQWSLDGISESVEILVDRWGIPHIYASNPSDLYRAQGFAAARDRLWQMDIWRRRGLGLLAEVFGASFAQADRARRLFLYRGDMQADWAAYGADVEASAIALAAGINDYVRLVHATPDLLSAEFVKAGFMPSLWAPGDIARIRSVGLRANVEEEFARSRLYAAGAQAADPLRRALSPSHEVIVPTGISPAVLPAEALELYRLALAEDPFPQTSAKVDAAAASNVWAIGGARTASGRPILANDPHRTHTIPSLRWLVHLDCPEFSCAGATEPVHPGVSNGHNRSIAFGFTWSGSDQEDLFVLALHPDDPMLFQHDGGWERFERVEETIAIAGEAPLTVGNLYCRFGPVIYHDQQSGKAVAVRSAFLEAGGAPYFIGANYHRAGSVADFRASVANAVAPAMNYCCADVSGEIGLFVRGKVPQRENWDGLLPVSGAGSHNWDGFVPAEAMPTVVNPASNWVANCNQRPLPDGYDFEGKRIGFEYADPTRFDRLQTLIETTDKVTMGDCAAWQNDKFHALGLAQVRALGKAMPDLPAALSEIFDAWDGMMVVESAAAAFVAVWLERHLRPALLTARLDGVDRKLVGEGDYRSLFDTPVDPELLVSTAKTALAELLARLGEDVAAWRLGDMQKMVLRHSYARFQALEDNWNIAPVPVGGHTNSLNKALSANGSLAVTFGPSFRLIMDVGAWDNTLVVNSPGQSGDPLSPSYSDHIQDWSNGTYVPLLWDREKVESETVVRIRLVPAGRT
jgi:penicillin amidase